MITTSQYNLREMKKLIAFVFLVFAANVTFGQGIVDKYYADLEEKETTTSVYVSSAMFKMISKIDIQTDDKEFNDLQDFVHSVKSFSLIKVPDVLNPKAYYKEGISKIENSHEELVRVRDGDTRLSVYVDQEEETIYELAVIGVVDGEFLAASLLGEMRLENISEFINKMEGNDFTSLRSLESIGATEMKVYPNPVGKGTDITIEVPEAMIGGKAVVFGLNGQVLQTLEADSAKLNVNTQDLTEGSYVVELSKNSSSLKKNFIVLR